MRFYLSSNQDGRIILDEVVHGFPIEALNAEPEYEGDFIYRSAWQVARDQVSECAYIFRAGFGYYLKGMK